MGDDKWEGDRWEGDKREGDIGEDKKLTARGRPYVHIYCTYLRFCPTPGYDDVEKTHSHFQFLRTRIRTRMSNDSYPLLSFIKPSTPPVVLWLASSSVVSSCRLTGRP